MEGRKGSDQEERGVMARTPESAPLGRILVWVRGAAEGGKGGQWMTGQVIPASDGFPAELRADGCAGDWKIPYWAPLPPIPFGEL